MDKFFKAKERGSTQLPWLSSYHSFSFNRYYDPANMGFGPLRVLNEDHVAPGGQFDTHGHQDMQIISLVTYGSMQHQDSGGHGSLLQTGDYQLMNAGSGITHSEANASHRDPLGFMQLWVVPRHHGGLPDYQYRRFEERAPLQLVASGTPDAQAFLLDQDIHVWQLRLSTGGELRHPLQAGWLRRIQLIEGELQVGQQLLTPGDGFIPNPLPEVEYLARRDSLALVFDVPRNLYQGQPHETH
ncbi:MAG: pirin family protein [Gammaproteobacteria bacterium]|nr:MAG: pirin family protein [Gammaproteobacteria bacterium]